MFHLLGMREASGLGELLRLARQGDILQTLLRQELRPARLRLGRLRQPPRARGRQAGRGRARGDARAHRLPPRRVRQGGANRGGRRVSQVQRSGI